MGFLARWAAAFALLAVTFNPTRYNFIAWARTHGDANLSVAVLVGILLLILYIIFLRATLRSIGLLGMALVLALVGALIWVLYDFGLVSLDDPGMNLWLALVVLSLMLGIGIGWSHVRRAITGQFDVDDIDE
jgi:hypothetical protein